MAILQSTPLLSKNHALALLAILPIAAPAAYLLYLRASISPHVKTSTGRRSPSEQKTATSSSSSSSPPALPISIPGDVSSEKSQHILSYERVTSHPIRLSTLMHSEATFLVTSYLRTTMEAFSWTPQAFLIRSLIKEPDVRATFDKARIEKMDFAVGELVNGVYKVSYRGDNPSGDNGHRVELMLDPPATYDGPKVNGMIVAAVERDEGAESIIFVNETWMWRMPNEKPTMLEGVVGRWMHSLLGGWLVVKGMKAVMAS